MSGARASEAGSGAPAGEIRRVCWSCKKLLAEFWPEQRGYSEYTPGSPESYHLSCEAGHFKTEEALASRFALATLLTRAADCPDYEQDPEIDL